MPPELSMHARHSIRAHATPAPHPPTPLLHAGVTGICVVGMSVEAVKRVISSARASVPGSSVVLHLADAAIDGTLVDEATMQMADAAVALLDGNSALIEAVRTAVTAAFAKQTLGATAPMYL